MIENTKNIFTKEEWETMTLIAIGVSVLHDSRDKCGVTLNETSIKILRENIIPKLIKITAQKVE